MLEELIAGCAGETAQREKTDVVSGFFFEREVSADLSYDGSELEAVA